MDRAIRDDLTRLMTESALAREDGAEAISRELATMAAPNLVLPESDAFLTRTDGLNIPSLAQLELLVSADGADSLLLDGIDIGNLLEEGADARSILKKGLVFLRHRRYAECVDWWTLHRSSLDANTSRLHLLLYIMEAFTYHLAGDRRRAADLQETIRQHPLYQNHVRHRR